MKKTEQSFNSTLKMGNCELKRTALKNKSRKMAAQDKEYFALIDRLKMGCQDSEDYTFRSELPPFKQAAVITGSYGFRAILEPHHIDHRENARRIDPFNIIMLLPIEHDDFTNERGVAKHYSKQGLKDFIRAKRLAQGFKYTGEFTAELEV